MKHYNSDEVASILKDAIIEKGRILLHKEIKEHPLLPSAKVIKRVLNQSVTDFYKNLRIKKPHPICRFCKSASTVFVVTTKNGAGRYKCVSCGKGFVYPYIQLPSCPYCISSNTRVAGKKKKYKCMDCNRSFRIVRKSSSNSKEYFIRLIAKMETVYISSLLATSLGLHQNAYIYIIEDDGEIIITKGKKNKGFKVCKHNKYNSYKILSAVFFRYLINKLRIENEYNVKIRTNNEGRIMEIISRKEIQNRYQRGRYAVERFITISSRGSLRFSVALILELGVSPQDQLIIIQHEGKYYLSLASVSEIRKDFGFSISMDEKFRRNAVASNVSLAKYLMDQFNIDNVVSFRIYTSELTELRGRKVVRLENIEIKEDKGR